MSSACDLIIENGVLKKYVGPGGNVEIPDGVTKISNKAFEKSKITNVALPQGVKCIGKEAFSQCVLLKNITLPYSVTIIEDGAFSGCTDLVNVILPENALKFGKNTFSFCSSLNNISIPEGVKVLNEGMFSDCTNLKYIKISESVNKIESFVFFDCRSLQLLTIPEGVESIGAFAFSNCKNLRSIAFPKKIKRIEKSTFSGCRNLKNIVIGEQITTIMEDAFSNCGKIQVTLHSCFKWTESAFRKCTVSVTVDKWTPDITKLLQDSKIDAIYVDAFGSLPPAYRRPTALRMITEKNFDPNSECGKACMRYLKNNAESLCAYVLDNPEAISFMCDHNLISAKDYDVYTIEAEKSGKVEIRALLLNYQNQLGVKDISRIRRRREALAVSLEDSLAEEKLMNKRSSADSSAIIGLSFVVTGRLCYWKSEAEIKYWLEKRGAKLETSITKKTNYLVIGEYNTSAEEIWKARDFGIQTIHEFEFNEMVGKKSNKGSRSPYSNALWE